MWIVSQGRENAGLSIVDWTRSLSGTNSAIAALAIAIAALAAFELWALIHVLRQNGRLLLRLEAVEAKLGGTEAPPAGLPVGNEAPGFELPDLSGDRVSLQTLLNRGNPLLLFFSEPGCSACDSILPEVSQWQRDYRDRLSIVPITSGDISQNRQKGKTYGLHNVLIQADREVAEAYRVEATPSAVLVKDGRIESPLAVGTDENSRTRRPCNFTAPGESRRPGSIAPPSRSERRNSRSRPAPKPPNFDVVLESFLWVLPADARRHQEMGGSPARRRAGAGRDLRRCL